MYFTKKALLSFVFLVFSASVSGSVAGAAVPLSHYSISHLPAPQLEEIAAKFEIVRKTAHGYEVLVPQTRASEFAKLAPQAELLEFDASAEARSAFAQSQQMHIFEKGYHSFAEVLEIMKSQAQSHPEIAELVPYGQSQQGKALMALRVSRHLKNKNEVPRILLTAATHGDEIITTEVLLSLMNDLLNGESNSRFAKILDGLEVVFIPVVNADGFSSQDRYDNDVDPNRSYPYPLAPNAKPTASIAAELQLIAKYPIQGSIDFHAYSGLVMYPWGYTRKALESSAHDRFESITAKMAATNDYGHGQISNILYIAQGSSVDYYFWKYKTLALGIELGESKAPPVSEIPRYIQDQQESTWMFLESFLNTTHSRN